jgi:hypothetical protein
MDEERDKLWELMGRARLAKLPPFFTANVLREIRRQSERRSFASWLAAHWRAAAAISAGLAAIAVGLIRWEQTQEIVEMDQLLLVQQVASNPDYEVINHLDELLAANESSLWTDSLEN